MFAETLRTLFVVVFALVVLLLASAGLGQPPADPSDAPDEREIRTGDPPPESPPPDLVKALLASARRVILLQGSADRVLGELEQARDGTAETDVPILRLRLECLHEVLQAISAVDIKGEDLRWQIAEAQSQEVTARAGLDRELEEIDQRMEPLSHEFEQQEAEGRPLSEAELANRGRMLLELDQKRAERAAARAQHEQAFLALAQLRRGQRQVEIWLDGTAEVLEVRADRLAFALREKKWTLQHQRLTGDTRAIEEVLDMMAKHGDKPLGPIPVTPIGDGTDAEMLRSLVPPLTLEEMQGVGDVIERSRQRREERGTDAEGAQPEGVPGAAVEEGDRQVNE